MQLIKPFAPVFLACIMGFGVVQGADVSDPILERFEFKNTPLYQALRVIAEVSDVNVVATEEAAKKNINIILRDIRTRMALRTLCKTVGLWMREEPGENVIRIMTAEEFQKDLVVDREEKTRIFDMLYPNAIAVAQSIEDLFGQRVVLSLGEIEDDLGLFGPDAGIASGGGSGSATGGSIGRSRSETRRQTSDVSRGSSFTFNDSAGGSSFRSGRAGSGTGSRGASSQRAEEQRVTGLTSEQLDQLNRLTAEGRTDLLQKSTSGQPPIYVSVNRQHNLVVVRTSDAEAMKDLECYIEEVDRPVAQVLIEVKIFQISLDDSFDSQFSYSIFERNQSRNPRDGQQVNPLLPLTSGTDTAANTVGRNLGGLGNFGNLTGSTLVYQYLDSNLRVRMQMLAGSGRVKALATPTLICANNSVARLFVGEQRPILEGFEIQTISLNENSSTVIQAPQLTQRDIGVTLEIIPRINADRTVALRIFQESSNVNIGGARIPTGLGVQEIDTVSTANAEATIVGQDGMTLAVGGLIRKESSVRRAKVPYLGDIPYIGLAFSKNSKLDARNEIVLLLTPHVIMTPDEGKAISASRVKHLTRNPALKKFLDEDDLPEERKSKLPGWLRNVVNPTEDRD